MGLFSRKKTVVAEVIQLTETVLTEGITADRIDEANGIIRGVKIIGRKSKHGYEYGDDALRQGQALYEGSEVNLEHPPRGQEDRVRPFLEGWGILKAIEVKPDGDYGDLHYLKEHAETPVILERIKRGFPIGLSHNARGKIVNRNGRRIVESLDFVRSVDLVRKGATTQNLWESEPSTMKKKISAIVAEHKAAHPALVALIEGADASILAAEVELVESASAEEQCREAAKTAMATLLESDGFDASRQQKFAELFKPAAKKPEPTQQPPATDKALLESVQAIGTRLERIEKDATISRVLDSHGLSRAGIGAERVKLLESLADEAAMGNVIKDWPPNVRGQRPPFSQTQTLTESAGNHAAPEVPKTREGIRSLYLSSRR